MGFFFPFFLFLLPPADYSQPQIRTATNFLVEKAQIELSLLCACANAEGTGAEVRLEARAGAAHTGADCAESWALSGSARTWFILGGCVHRLLIFNWDSSWCQG